MIIHITKQRKYNKISLSLTFHVFESYYKKIKYKKIIILRTTATTTPSTKLFIGSAGSTLNSFSMDKSRPGPCMPRG